MKLSVEKKIGVAIKASGSVKAWKKSPGDLTAACVAALHYALKDGKPKVVVPGNSYGHKVFSIVNETEDLTKFTVMKVAAKVAVVHPNGEVFQATAE